MIELSYMIDIYELSVIICWEAKKGGKAGDAEKRVRKRLERRKK